MKIEKIHSIVNNRLMSLSKYMDFYDADLIEKNVNMDFMLLTHKLSNEEGNAFDELTAAINKQKATIKRLIETFISRLISSSKPETKSEATSDELTKINSDLNEIRREFENAVKPPKLDH